MTEPVVSALQVLSVRRRRLRPFVDFGPVFLFFGISGVDHGREARLQRRFEQEYYPHVVTARLGGVGAGRYRLEGLPEDANRRPWIVGADGVVRGELSEEGLGAFRVWLGGNGGKVRAVALES
ncbi:hypothetical protein GO986_03930 [Deinococcus sp. HMF7620]|uniref:Uncharacterized protein n=1 Tax=Deinococcus arboris TaxID=2682977 RepID=A0A7C9HWN8_9DEIO|nr:hypothetical protein [Deinococcus arboris]MVN85910.1 hypothetical protein [Deinococcus arboris]